MSTLFVLALVLALTPGAALAGEVPAKPRLAQHGVLLQGSIDAWSPTDLASLSRGAQSVPKAIREQVGPLRFRRVRQICPFGVGVYNSTCPTFGPEHQDTFFVYDAPPIQGDGPPTRLRALDKTERRDILVRRAVVHAFVATLDRKLGWSSDASWRRLNAWRDDKRAFNKDPWGYSRYLGMRSAHLDLVTFAEEYFVRPEDVLRDSSAKDATERLASLDRDLAMQCQEFSKMRFLATKTRALDPEWAPPENTHQFPTGCAAFDRWARLDKLEGIDVVFAAATADRPQSLWGHLMLHIRHKDTPEGLEPVYQFGAVTDTDVNPFDYLSHGLMGGFYSVFDPNSFRTTDRLILQKEQRSLRRYRLHLSQAQALQVLQRVWEVERRQRLPYWFFDENCAAFLVDLLQSALPELDIPERSAFIVAPTDVLDHLAGVENGAGRPLLEKRADDLYSNREFARWAIKRRAQTLESLLARLDVALPELREKLLSTTLSLGDADPNVRRRGYGRAAKLLEQIILRETQVTSTPDRLVADAIAYLFYCVRIERYFVEDHLYRSHDLLAKMRLDPLEHTAAERLAMRRELYRHEDLARRQRQLLARERQFLSESGEAEHRQLDDDQRATLALEGETRRAYEAAIAAQHRLVTRLEPGFDAVAFWEAERARFRRDRARHDARSLGSSGKGRLAIGAELSGAIELDYSFLYERLGSQRRRGFRADIETRVFGLNVLVSPTEDALDDLDIDLVLLRYLSLEQRLEPVRQSIIDAFGYGFDIRAGHDALRGVDVEFQSAAGLLYPLWASEHFSDHLVVGAFPSVRWIGATEADTTLGGVWLMASAQVHLYGPFANVLRLEAGYTPFYQLQPSVRPGEDRLHFDAVAEASTNHLVGTIGQGALILAPYFRVEHTDLAFGAGPGNFTRWRAGLRVELPL